jgi:hypothetical protein
MCRQLATSEVGDPKFWREAATLIEMASVENMNPVRLLQHVHQLDRDSLGDLRVLGYVLVTWHHALSNAFHCQLACIELLHRWYPSESRVHRQLMLPYFAEFWRRAISERRAEFDFPPGFAAEAIERALQSPEPSRVRTILLAASQGFRISRNLSEAMQWLRTAPR